MEPLAISFPGAERQSHGKERQALRLLRSEVKSTDEQRKAVNDACTELAETLKKAGIRAQADLREGYTPGYKFNDWEQKVRI